MKTPITRRTIISAIASLLTLAGFIMLITGCDDDIRDTHLQGKFLSDGQYEEIGIINYNNGYSWIDHKTTGYRDKKTGNWTGEIKETFYEHDSYVVPHSYATGNYIDGKKHGKWTELDTLGNILACVYYDMGRIVKREKSALSTDSIPSAHDILLTKYPLFIDFLALFDLEDDTLKIYTDTLDTLLSKLDFDTAAFDLNYSNVQSDLTKNEIFNSIATTISSAIYLDGLYCMKSSELRLAELDRNRKEVEKTYDAITANYPGYLASMNAAGATNEDFATFCLKLDSIMDSGGALDPAEPMFIDSVDVRLSKALMKMASANPSLAALKARFEQLMPGRRVEESLYLKEGLMRLKTSQQSGDKAVTAVINSLLILYLEADVVRLAVKESCFLRRKWAELPVITTFYLTPNSTTSVTLRGNVIESTGAEVTSRGFVWATTYNPTLDNNKVISGSGKGIFQETIDGLEQGKTYYARSFATNKAGTAYGNLIEFTTDRAASVDIIKSGSFDLSVYPNPASGMATLNCSVSSAGDYQLTVLDMNGRAVLSRKINFPRPGLYNQTLDLSTYAAGFYNIRISNGKSTSVCKLVVTK